MPFYNNFLWPGSSFGEVWNGNRNLLNLSLHSVFAIWRSSRREGRYYNLAILNKRSINFLMIRTLRIIEVLGNKLNRYISIKSFFPSDTSNTVTPYNFFQ